MSAGCARAFGFGGASARLFALDAAGATAGGDGLGLHAEAVIILAFFLVAFFVFLFVVFFVLVVVVVLFVVVVCFILIMCGEEFRHTDERADMRDGAGHCRGGTPECAEAHARCHERQAADRP